MNSIVSLCILIKTVLSLKSLHSPNTIFFSGYTTHFDNKLLLNFKLPDSGSRLSAMAAYLLVFLVLSKGGKV